MQYISLIISAVMVVINVRDVILTRKVKSFFWLFYWTPIAVFYTGVLFLEMRGHDLSSALRTYNVILLATWHILHRIEHARISKDQS